MTVEQQAAEILAAIPEDVRQEHEGYRAAGERERWKSGELAQVLIEELYPQYTKTACRLAVAKLYHCSIGSIRDREYVVERVPSALRYAHPLLTFHHWRPCCQAGAKKMEYVAQVEAYFEAYGELPNVDSVYGWVYGTDDPVPVWSLRLGSLSDTATKIEQDELAPAGVRALVRAFHKRLGAIMLASQATQEP